MPPSLSLGEAKWIWVPNYDDNVDPGRFVLFRKVFYLQSAVIPDGTVRVSADTRYRLFVNGARVSFGPCKSYLTRWYYETVDISHLLLKGKNVISAKVLRFSNAYAGSSSMMRANIPGFFLHGIVGDQKLHTDATWKAKEDIAVQIVPRSEWNYALGPPFLSLNERFDNRIAETGWETIQYEDRKWAPAVIKSVKSKMMPMLEPWKLYERSIPALPEIPSRFEKALTCCGPVTLDQWNKFLQESNSIQIPAHTKVVVEIQSSVLTTGFLRFACQASAGVTVKITCAESYERPIEAGRSIGALRWKGDRSDFEYGKLYGPDDTFTTKDGTNVYEPFWFRTFRFIRLEISGNEAPLIVTCFDYRETHYPLDIGTKISGSSELETFWKVSLNTLRNCMHETYEDCPFYEQNQFAMDSRIQILFTYQLSRDDRLARKCMQEFYASRRDDGLVETHFPVPFRATNIPQFSLYWILMVYDHMEYFGDEALVKRYIGTVDGILDHFQARLTPSGLVGRFDDESWPFIDWVKEWHGSGGLQTMGMPQSYREGDGATAYNSLVYSMALNHAADLCDFIRRKDTAAEYRARARAINQAVNQHCFDGELYRDGPGSKEVCQHSQVFAVLSDAVTGETARQVMRRTLEDPTLPRCSYSMSFYVLRATAKVGLYEEYFTQLMEPWRKMVQNNLTTWAEDDLMFRSDCHGWSSSPIYEIVRELFGLTPGKPGSASLRVEPRMGLQDTAKGTFITAHGDISISWGNGSELVIQSTSDATVDVVLNGSTESRRIQANEPSLFGS